MNLVRVFATRSRVSAFASNMARGWRLGQACNPWGKDQLCTEGGFCRPCLIEGTGELAPVLDFGAVVVNRLGCGLAVCVLWARRPGRSVSGGEQSRRRVEGVSMVRDRIGFCDRQSRKVWQSCASLVDGGGWGLLCRRRTEKGREAVVGSGLGCVIVGPAVVRCFWWRVRGMPAQGAGQVRSC